MGFWEIPFPPRIILAPLWKNQNLAPYSSAGYPLSDFVRCLDFGNNEWASHLFSVNFITINLWELRLRSELDSYLGGIIVTMWKSLWKIWTEIGVFFERKSEMTMFFFPFWINCVVRTTPPYSLTCSIETVQTPASYILFWTICICVCIMYV